MEINDSVGLLIGQFLLRELNTTINNIPAASFKTIRCPGVSAYLNHPEPERQYGQTGHFQVLCSERKTNDRDGQYCCEKQMEQSQFQTGPEAACSNMSMIPEY
jgi:hypothetical protein